MLARRMAVLLTLGAALLAQSKKSFVVVLVGATGSGKTTQAEFLKKKYGIPSIDVQALLRANPAAAKDPSKVNELIRQRVTAPDARNGFVLDGYPATREQADYLGELVKANALSAPVIIQLDVPDAMIRERLKKRGGPEDKPDLIEKRLAQYHRELDLIRSYYPDANIWEIDGTRAVRDVSNTIVSILADEGK